MAKQVVRKLKLQIQAGKATPAPPVGPALGQAGVNIPEFCKQFNARTSSMGEYIVPVIITVYNDKSFTFVTKTPPAADLLKKAAGVEKGSGEPNRKKVAKVSSQKIREIAELKMQDLNATSIEGAVKIIEGTARSMGIEVE